MRLTDKTRKVEHLLVRHTPGLTEEVRQQLADADLVTLRHRDPKLRSELLRRNLDPTKAYLQVPQEHEHDKFV